MTWGCNVQYSAPVEALYLILDQIPVVLCEVPKHHNLVCTERFFFDFMYPAWAFTRYKCWVRLLMLSIRSSLYSSNITVRVASAAQSVVCHWQNRIQSPYPDEWAHHPGTFSKHIFPDMTHNDASCTPCYLSYREPSWLGLCMYTTSQSRQPAILHSDECYIRKHNECLMIQQGHTVLVLECKTWKIRFLYWDICLWMHCTVLRGWYRPFWTSVYRFWGHLIWASKLHNVLQKVSFFRSSE